MKQRNVKDKWKVKLNKVSDIHTSGEVIPLGKWSLFDPFLVLMEDIFQKSAFDFHPHRGIETVTYVIDGEMHHSDNNGGNGIIKKGDVQWMTAGKGIIHNEEPPEGITTRSLQLWVNLPKASKMVPPRYQNLIRDKVPVVEEPGVSYTLFSGKHGSVVAPTHNYAEVTMIEITIEKGYTAVQDIPGNYNGFIYILEGKGIFGGNNIIGEGGDVLLLDSFADSISDTEIQIIAEHKLKLLFFAGKPLNEPIAAKGPFVMNTEDEIRQAYKDYREGKF